MKIIGISGSLRKQSTHTALLHSMKSMAQENGDEFEVSTLEGIPLYNQDVMDQGVPQIVQQLHNKITSADAVVLASPEYNYSVTGVLKNAIDWLSRVPDQSFKRKPVGIVGVSPGNVGTARGQHHLRQILVYLNPKVICKPEIMVANSSNKFNSEGTLEHQETEEFLQKMLSVLKETAAT